MPYRRKTLRQLPPETRALAKTIGELDTLVSRLKRLLPRLSTAETLARAEAKRQAHYSSLPLNTPVLVLGEEEYPHA